MSIEFVFGSAGSGKSSYLRRKAKEFALEKRTRTCFFIVPDQYTYSAQMALCREFESGVTVNVEVLSFERLARRVFNELSTPLSKVLDDSGKALVLSKVIEKKKDDLFVLSKKSLEKAGMVDEIKSFISELMQYDISPAFLSERARDEDNALSPAFRKKLLDIAVLYEGFLSEIEGKYTVGDELLTLLTEVLDLSSMAGGEDESVFFFDSFTGFTPLQYKVIRKLLASDCRLIFSLCIGDEEDPYSDISEENLFYLTKKTVRRLSEIGNETGCEISELERLYKKKGEVRRFGSPGLLSLSNGIFRPGKKEVLNGPCDEIKIFRFETPLLELTHICAKILSMVREEGYRFSDFAVLMPGLSEYAPLVPGIFQKYKVPYNLDLDQKCVNDPLITLIESAFEIVLFDFSYPFVMKYLRSHLSGVSKDEADLFDSFLLSTGIRGHKKYEQVFALLPDGFSADDLVSVNSVREKMMKSLRPFFSSMKRKENNVRDYCTALYTLFTELEIEDKLWDMKGEADKEGAVARSAEFERIYPFVCDQLDRMVEILSEEKLSLERFKELFILSLSEISLFSLPFSSDCVTIGDLERTRVEDIKVLFLTGADDSAIPGNLSKGGVISETEREGLLSLDLEIAPSGRQRAFIQRFYLYLALTKPSERLFLTYSTHDMKGAVKRPSYLINEVKSLFQKGEGEEDERVITKIPFELRAVSFDTLFDYLSEALMKVREGEADEKETEVLSNTLPFFLSIDEKRGRSLLDQFEDIYEDHSVSEKTMEDVHDKTIIGSVSNLSTYESCPYSYFLRYELSLKEKNYYEINSADIGSFYHAVLSTYSKMILESRGTFFDISPEEIKVFFEKAFEKEVLLMKKARDLEMPSAIHMMKNMKRTLLTTIEAFHFQIGRGRYEPRLFEKSLAEAKDEILLSNGTILRMQGAIDRIDVYETKDRTFLRVIDYKSSDREINFSDIYYGLEMQLFTYLSEGQKIFEKGSSGKKEILPGGILYYVISDPILEGVTGDDEELFRKRLLTHRMKGLLNSDEENLKAFDEKILSPADDPFSGRSPVVPLSTKKGGEPSETNRKVCLSSDDINMLSCLVRGNIIDSGEAIMKGHFPISPYLKTFETGADRQMKTACSYCPYFSICGFEDGLNGNSYRRLYKKELSDCREKQNKGEDNG